jgi:hypothetical protein
MLQLPLEVLMVVLAAPFHQLLYTVEELGQLLLVALLDRVEKELLYTKQIM